MTQLPVKGNEFLTWLLTRAPEYVESRNAPAFQGVVLDINGRVTARGDWSLLELEMLLHHHQLSGEVFVRVVSGDVVDRNGRRRSLSRLVSQFVRRLREAVQREVESGDEDH